LPTERLGWFSPSPVLGLTFRIVDWPAATGDRDEATYPAFEHVADEIEGRVAPLLADLRTRQVERTHHG